MYENFLQAVRGVEAPLATGWDGYHAYELNVATHLSIQRRQPAQRAGYYFYTRVENPGPAINARGDSHG